VTTNLAIAALFVVVAVLAGVDLIADLGEGTTRAHVALEAGVVLVGLAGAGWTTARIVSLAREAQGLRARAHDLTARLDASREEATRWRREAAELISGLSAAIDRQLERWALTPAEKETALLLLKGLSHKEIASLRDVSEATARQQAGSIYRKAGLEGRHDLAAFFLEDMLGPRSAS
jgi:DNA-binding CsgD family transcriptional regulator